MAILDTKETDFGAMLKPTLYIRNLFQLKVLRFLTTLL